MICVYVSLLIERCTSVVDESSCYAQLDSLLIPCTHKGIQHALYMWENFATSDSCVRIWASVE
jgi:hypothetical protein